MQRALLTLILATFATLLAGPTADGADAQHRAAPTDRVAAVRRYNETSRGAWRARTAEGIPQALGQPRWGDSPYAIGFGVFGIEKWTYARFPLPCAPSSTPLPAYQVLWVEPDLRHRPTVMDTEPYVVRGALRRVASIFAASANAPIRSQQDLEHSLIPRFITETDRASGLCRPRIDRVAVPVAVLRREAIQNWDNPRTGVREQGLYAYLQSHGYPARENRRVLTIVADLRSPDYAWWGAVGEAQSLGIGTGYGPLDDRPGAQNTNNAGDLWATVFTDGRAWDFEPGAGDLVGVIAHEISHGLGAVLETAPHHNDENFAHASDCADLMCYNTIDEPGQDYLACSRATEQTFDSFTALASEVGRASLRLDCHRDDYFAERADGSGEKQWAEQRWSISRNRFLWGNQDREPYVGPMLVAPEVPPSCLTNADGYCPPGVQRPAAVSPRTATQRRWSTIN